MGRYFFWVIAVVLLASAPAGALTISVTSLAPGDDNSVDSVDTNDAHTSAVEELESGGTVLDAVGVNESARVRYAANAWSDATFGNNTVNLTHAYEVAFTVTADVGTVYDLEIDAAFSGLVQRVDDSYLGYGSASVSSVSIFMDQNSTGATLVPSLETSGASVAYDYDDSAEVISDTGSTTLVGLSGTTQLTFSIEFTSTLNSDSDEVGFVLGLPEAYGPASFVTTSEYGVELAAGRDIAEDGHFLGVEATVTEVNPIPEPSTALLLALGLLGLRMGTPAGRSSKA